MADDALLKVHIEDAEVTFMLGASDDAETVENVDVEVVLAEGSRWSATFLSLAEVSRIMNRWKVTGECLGGSFFRCPDLVIINKGGAAEILEIIKELVVTGELQNTLMPLDNDM
jgi:hypothetical protein